MIQLQKKENPMINRRFFYLITIFLYFFCGITYTQNALTYERSGGRLGDQLLYYAKRKILERDFNLILYECSFPFSDKFILHGAEKRFNRHIAQQYKRKVKIQNALQIKNNSSQKKTLYIANFYTRTENHFKRMWRDPEYAQEIKKMLSPTIAIHKLDLPKDKICVAVHIRKGSGPDQPLASVQLYSGHHGQVSYHHTNKRPPHYSDKRWPTKFPPDQYYIDQIKKLSEMLNDQPLYVYLFTDHKNPQQLCNLYKNKIGKNNITFDYSRKSNYQNRIIDDLFNMAEFDCLIRSSSHFSQSAQLIGNHIIVFFPKHVIWKDKTLIIDKVGILQKNEIPQKSRIIIDTCEYVYEDAS